MVKDDNGKLNHYIKNNTGLKNKIPCLPVFSFKQITLGMYDMLK